MGAQRETTLASEPDRTGSARVDARETIALVARDGTVLRAFAITSDGCTQADAPGRLGSVVPPPVHDLLMTAVQAALDSGGCEVAERRVELEGELRDLAFRTVALPGDRALCIVTDLTLERRAQVALRSSEARFRSLLEHAGDALIVLDTDNRIVMVNEATCTSLAYDEETLLQMQLSDITPDAPARATFERWKAAGAPEPLLVEAEHVRSDGTTFDVEVHVRRMEFRGRTHYAALVRDATQRKRVEAALRRSETTMRLLLEHAPAVIVVSDLEGRTRFVSGDLAGWDRHRLLGKRLSSLLGGGDAEELERALERIRASGVGEDVEVAMPHASAGEVWLSVRIARVDVDDESPTLVHIIQDATEARRTREALRASEARFRQLVDQAVDGIYVFDGEGRIVDVNERGCASLGCTREELLGQSMTSPSPDLVLAEVLDACRRLAPRGSITFETVHARRDGRVFPVELRIGRLVGEGPPRFVALARDISDRQNLERAALDAIEREQRRFGRDLHDGIGQDLAGIAFLAKALEGTLAVGKRPEAAQAAEIARRVAQTIAQTRAMAHGLAPVGVHGDELETALEALASDTSFVFGVRCRVDAHVEKTVDAAVATALYRIAQEAVTNALRHAQAIEIVLSLRITASEASLVVRDDGIGIAVPAERPGGLGLQIMTLRARRVGGRLDVAGQPAGGTRVTCSVPLPGRARSGPIPASGRPAGRGAVVRASDGGDESDPL